MTQTELDLIHRYLNGTIDEAHYVRLQAVLRDNPEARRLLRALSTVDAKLQDLAAANPATMQAFNATAVSLRTITDRILWLRRLPWLVLASASMLMVAAIWMMGKARSSHDGYIATLVFADACEWQAPVGLREGQRLAAGSLRLRRGMAVLRFDSGATVVINGEAEAELRSRCSALLQRGAAVVCAANESAGFILQTPASDVLDLGTEFAAKVEPSGATEVHVLEGQIAYRKPSLHGRCDDEPAGELLSAGQAVRYDHPETHTPRNVALNATRFEQLLQQAKFEPHAGSLIAHEPFAYPAGKLPPLQGNGGTGWAGPWQRAPWCKVSKNLAGDLSIVVSPFKMPVPPSGESAHILEAFDGFQTVLRRFARPIRMDRNGIYYMSGVVRWEAVPGQIVAGSQVRMMLRASADLMGEHLLLNLPSHLHPQIQRRPNEVYTSPSTVPVNESQLWVAKIIAQQNGGDEMHFRIYGEDETPGFIEPATWHVSVRGFRSDARLDTLGLSTYFGTGRYWFGDVRLGTHWRSVVPAPRMNAAKNVTHKEGNT